MIKIRPFAMSDFGDWLPLWDANNQDIANEAVTSATWERICGEESMVFGLGAFEGSTLVGLVHYVLHHTTGGIEPICYMQDLYVDPAHRRKGIAQKLVKAVANIGRREQWGRMYWLAERSNDAAQNLYKTLGVHVDFTLHILPLED